MFTNRSLFNVIIVILKTLSQLLAISYVCLVGDECVECPYKPTFLVNRYKGGPTWNGTPAKQVYVDFNSTCPWILPNLPAYSPPPHLWRVQRGEDQSRRVMFVSPIKTLMFMVCRIIKQWASIDIRECLEECDNMIIAIDLGAWSLQRLDKLIR